MLHCMAQNKSAEKAERLGQGWGLAGPTRAGGGGLTPPQPPPTSNSSSSLPRNCHTPSQRTRCYFLGNSLIGMFVNTQPSGTGRAATEVRQRGRAGQGSALTECANKGPLCAQPLSSSNCLALRKNTSARLPEGTTPSLYSQRGNLGRGHHPTKVLRDPPPHNSGLVVATHTAWLWSPRSLCQVSGHVLAVASS